MMRIPAATIMGRDRMIGTPWARATNARRTVNTPAAARPATPTQALCSSTMTLRDPIENPSARSAAYSLIEPTTAAVKVWLVMMTATARATILPNRKATPAPDSDNQ